jgi:hypothetical protein
LYRISGEIMENIDIMKIVIGIIVGTSSMVISDLWSIGHGMIMEKS